MLVSLSRSALAAPFLVLLACSRWASDAAPNDGLPGKESSRVMAHADLAAAIKRHLVAVDFPEIEVKVEPWGEDVSRIAVYFISASFSDLYPEQRFHRLIHALPEEFVEQHLAGSVWFELAPGERPEELLYADEEEVASIEPDVMRVLEVSGFFAALEDAMAPADTTVVREPCHGDFRISKRILTEKGIHRHDEVDMIADVHHVLMSKGAYCDCEILLNAHKSSRIAKELWQKYSEETKQREE